MKSDTFAIDKTQYVVVNTLPEGDHEYVAIEYSQALQRIGAADFVILLP